MYRYQFLTFSIFNNYIDLLLFIFTVNVYCYFFLKMVQTLQGLFHSSHAFICRGFLTALTHYTELCPTCQREQTCSRRLRFDRPIVYCDQYVGPLDKSLNNQFVELKGLCSSCLNRFTCTLPKAEGGIWHCNNYM